MRGFRILTSFNNIDTSWIPSFPLSQEQQNCIVRQRPKIFSIFDLRAITFQNDAHWLRGGNAKFVFTYVNNDKINSFSTFLIHSPSRKHPTTNRMEPKSPSELNGHIPLTINSSKLPTTNPLRIFRQLSQIFSGLFPRDS